MVCDGSILLLVSNQEVASKVSSATSRVSDYDVTCAVTSYSSRRDELCVLYLLLSIDSDFVY